MFIDYCINSYDNKDSVIKNDIKSVLDLNILNSVTVPYQFLRTVKTILPKEVLLSCLIDYPLGISDAKTRTLACKNAIDNGAKCLDIAMPQILVCNRKYDKIKEDIDNIKKLDPNIKIRYILEYRQFNHNLLKKICSLLESLNVTDIFPSSGFFIDNLSDNIIASVFLYKNSKNLNVILTGNVWKKDQFDVIHNSGLYGFRAFCINTIKNYYEHTLNNNGV